MDPDLASTRVRITQPAPRMHVISMSKEAMPMTATLVAVEEKKHYHAKCEVESPPNGSAPAYCSRPPAIATYVHMQHKTS